MTSFSIQNYLTGIKNNLKSCSLDPCTHVCLGTSTNGKHKCTYWNQTFPDDMIRIEDQMCNIPLCVKNFTKSSNNKKTMSRKIQLFILPWKYKYCENEKR